jgi:hypothetical protein
MPAPTIEPRTSLQIARDNEAFTLQLGAFNTPTSWAAVGLPAGLSLNTSTGAITGTPTTPGYYQVPITATNGSGTDEVVLIFVVLEEAAPETDGFTFPVDLDFFTRRLSIPGVGSPQPAGRPPAGSGTNDPLATWIEGERFVLSLGVKAQGVGRDMDLNRIKVLWRPTGTDATIELHQDHTDVTETGTGTTARYEVPVYVDPDKVRGALSDGENVSGERVTGYLQIVGESSQDAADFSYSSTQTITTLSASDSEAKTFNVTLESTNATALEYTVTIDLVCPSDTALNCTVVRNITAHWNSGGSTYVLDTNTGDANDTGTPTNPAYWSTTLTPTSITADATGLQITATATTSANAQAGVEILLNATQGVNVDLFLVVDSTITVASGPHDIVFYETGAVEIGTAQLEDGDTAATLKTKIETALGETLVAVEFVSTTQIRLILPTGTAVVEHDFGGEVALGAGSTYPPAVSYSNATITMQVVGVEMPELFTRISSQIAPMDLEMTYDA